MKFRHYIFALVPLFFCCLSNADTAVLSSVADAEIQEFHASNNFGVGNVMISGKLGDTPPADSVGIGEVRRALLRFDLSGIPSNAQATAANLRVVVAKAPPPDGPTPAADSIFDLRRLLRSWTETGATWNSPWSVPGATGATDSIATASASVPITQTNTYTFASAGLISDVQRWITNASSNFGWLLVSQDEVSYRTARHFGTRENTGGAAPVLTINYTIPANPPLLGSVSKTNNQIRFTFPAESNRTYTVESRASLSVTNWTTLTSFGASPTPTNRVVTDALEGTHKFYRVTTP